MFVIQEYLKSRVQHVASLRCQHSLLHLLLSARAATATTMNIQQNLDKYAQWYKQNIGEMSYALSSEQFHAVLTILEDSVHYELEIDYLEVSITANSCLLETTNLLFSRFMLQLPFRLVANSCRRTKANARLSLHA